MFMRKNNTLEKDRDTDTAKIYKIAYTIPDVAYGIRLDVKKSANAWWLDQWRVQKLLDGFSYAFTIPEACFTAGITPKQYKYFALLHPEVNEIRKGLVSTPDLQAKARIIRALYEGDLETCKWWAEHMMQEEFGSHSRRGRQSKRQQNSEALHKQEEERQRIPLEKQPELYAATLVYRTLKKESDERKRQGKEELTREETEEIVMRVKNSPEYPKPLAEIEQTEIQEVKIPQRTFTKAEQLANKIDQGIEYSDPDFDPLLEELKTKNYPEERFRMEYKNLVMSFLKNRKS
jgi:hypothetical protein